MPGCACDTQNYMAEIVITEEPADNDDGCGCLGQYLGESDRRFRTGFDVDAALPLGRPRVGP